MAKPILLVVTGPTAVGKTALCVQLAKHFSTDVISADSRQFYKEMQIGTAKPSTEEMGGVSHHFIDNRSIHQPYDVGLYEKGVLDLLEKLFQKKRLVILTGGSGLFIKAVCEGFDELPKVNSEIREKVKQRYENEGITALQAYLAQRDAPYYAEVDINNPQRLMRAIEVIEATGKPFSDFRKGGEKKRPFQIIKIMLNRNREELYERINTRMDLMLAEGLIEEAKQLYPYKYLNALQTVGYQELFDFWDRKYDWEETVRLLKQNSRRYAKRQITWFKRDSAFAWFHPDEIDSIIAYINQKTH